MCFGGAAFSRWRLPHSKALHPAVIQRPLAGAPASDGDGLGRVLADADTVDILEDVKPFTGHVPYRVLKVLAERTGRASPVVETPVAEKCIRWRDP